MRIGFDEVPLEVRRRAARHLETVRGTPMAPGADAAALGDEACPLYRPDVDGIAYWELEVVGVETAARPTIEDRSPPKADRGFIVLAAHPHDVPIPHWSVELEPPSRTLEAQAKDRPVARVVKLDALAYAAEDEAGTYLTHIGQFPPMPSGLPTWLPKERTVSSLTSSPAKATADDRRVSKQTAKRTGVRAPHATLVPWRSWAQVKRQYRSAYRLHLQDLRTRAEQLWQVEELVAKLGEGMHEGDRLVVPLLKPGKAELAGDGAGAVTMRVLDRRPPAVELLAGGAADRKEQSFDLRLSYEDGSSETLPFFVVPKGTPSNRHPVLPHPKPVPLHPVRP